MLLVDFTNGEQQNREATEFGNQTRTNPGHRGTVSDRGSRRQQKILDEFTEVTGFHRKHAIRALSQRVKQAVKKAARSRLYDEAVVQSLTILWEAADRICGKRLKPAIPVLLEPMERHGHLALAPEIRDRVLKAARSRLTGC